jgi:FKBP-type peptidyl-prolyl cis-trans isomerase
MFRKLFLFAWALSLALHCNALDLTTEDASVLKTFFQTILQQTEGGYVLYGTKPICIHGFCVEDQFVKENEQHRAGVVLREGALKWKGLYFDHPSQNIVIHVYNHADTLAKNYRHVLFINKKLFLETVAANLPLFQYVLGPDATPSRLLEQLTDPEKSFHSVLKNDKVLIGIVLGFGTENSLYVSRIEDLEATLFASEKVPYKSLVSYLAAEKPEFGQMLLANNSSSSESTNYTPSFGYGSLEEEVKGLTQQIEVSSLKLARDSPPFVFGRLKNHERTGRFVEELEMTQSKIQSLLSSSTLLEDVLHLISPDEPIRFTQKEAPAPHSKLLSYFVAANIWNLIVDEGPIYQQAFIEGMKGAENQSESTPVHPFKYEKLKAFIGIQNNLDVAKTRFQELERDKQFKSVCPSMLYYKTMQSGSGALLEKQIKVTAHYAIKTPDDKVLADTWKGGTPESIDLSTTIPGFAWGLKGMKVGEIREIFIHPRLAYGVFTTLEKGIYLKAVVQLISINEKEKGEFPPLALINIDENIPANLQEGYQEEAKRVGQAQGFGVWSHYQKAKQYTLEEIVEWTSRFQSGASADISSEEAQNAIYRLHWDIYRCSP